MASLFALLVGLFYAPLLLGARTFPRGDFTDHFLPFSLFQQSELLAGRLPVWNPYTYAGHPFLADVQAAVYYPLSNLFLLLTLSWTSPAARLYWLQVEAAVHLILAAYFTYLLARTLTARADAAFVAAVAFAFSGYLTGYPPLQLAVLRTAVWLPLILWLLWRAFEQPSEWSRWGVAAVAYTVAFLAGHSQTFFLLSHLVAGWALFLLLASARRSRFLLRRSFAGLAFFGLLFLALSAAQLWPSLEFTRLSVRANPDYAFLSGGFPLQDTWQMLLPGVLTQFSPLYVSATGAGLVVLALASTASRVWARRREGHAQEGAGSGGAGPLTVVEPMAERASLVSPHAVVLFFALVTLLALLVSYGGNFALYPILYRWAPGWQLFRGQERAAYLVAFGLSILAGYGAAYGPLLSLRLRRRVAALFVALMLAATALFGILWQLAGRSAVGTPRFLVIAGFVLAMATIFAVILSARLSPRRMVVAFILLVSADLFFANGATNLSPSESVTAVARPPEALALAAAVASDPAAAAEPVRVYNEFRLYEDYGIIAGLEDVWGSSPLRLARYALLFQEFPLDRMWRLTAVEYLLTWRRELFEPSQLLAEFPQANDSTYLHRLVEPNPRAWVVNSVQLADDEEAARLLADHAFDLETTATIAEPLPLRNGSGQLAPPGPTDVQMIWAAPHRRTIRVNSQSGGLLVVSENWMPGWQATARSRSGVEYRLPVVRANLAFLGIPVSAGAHTIELVYQPLSVWGGLLLSAAALALYGLVLVAQRDARPAHSVRAGASLLALPLAVALAFGLRLFRLGHQELRGDEAFGYFFSLRPFREIVRATFELSEPHPVGSYFVERIWLALAGHTEFSLRFISVAFGVVAVVVLYRLARRLGFSLGAAALAAFLLAGSPYAIWHSQDARMYSMSLALTLASTWLALEAFPRGRRIIWVAYIVVTWLALHVHYFAAFVVLAQTIFVLLRLLIGSAREPAGTGTEFAGVGGALRTPSLEPSQPPPLITDVRLLDGIRWGIAQGALWVAYAPWLWQARAILSEYSGNGDSPRFLEMAERALSVFLVGESIPDEYRPALALLSGLVVAVGAARLVLAGPAGRRAVLLLLLYLLVPVGLTWMSALSRPIFNERYLIAASPPFYLLLPAALWPRRLMPATFVQRTSLRPRSRAAIAVYTSGAALLAVLVLGALALSLDHYYSDPAFSKTRGWRGLAGALERGSGGLSTGTVRLAQNFPDPTLWYYYRGTRPHLVLPPAAHDVGGARREVDALVAAGVERIILPVQPAGWWDDDNLAQQALASRYDLIAQNQIHGWPVQVYARLDPAELEPIDVPFDNGVSLDAVALRPSDGSGFAVPGGVVAVHLGWTGNESALAGSEKIFLHLLDQSGALVAQVDPVLDPADLNAVSTYGLVLPDTLAPGRYHLVAGLYDPAQPGAPRVLTEAGQDAVDLGAVSVFPHLAP